MRFLDLYSFTVEGTLDDANLFNEVRERVREQGRVWWALEASKGAGWYLQPKISSLSEGIAVSSLSLSVLANTIALKRLIRKGIPLAFTRVASVQASLLCVLLQAPVRLQKASKRVFIHLLQEVSSGFPCL